MGLEMKRIILIVAVLLLVLCGIGIGLGLKGSPPPTLELEVWPRAGSEKEPLIQYNGVHASSWGAWANRTNHFLTEYHVMNAANLSQCSSGSSRLEQPGVCDVNVDSLQPCTADNHYGYHKSSPCIFLRLTKVVDWIPQPYNTTDDLPAEMPLDLKTHISEVAGTADANTVWVTCEGITPADKEYIGPVTYIPSRGFPPYYFPFTNKMEYLSPVVAVHFARPHVGVLINIECSVWAKNIDEQHRSAHFWFLID